MFDIGLQELALIFVIALLVFGPKNLPQLGRSLGRAMREFRRASDEFRSTVETNLYINDPEPLLAPSSPPAAEPVTAAPPPSEAEASPTGEAATASPPPEPGEPYCAQRGSRLFHRRECSWVARIPENERIDIKRMADARDQGFVTCPVCEPWESE